MTGRELLDEHVRRFNAGVRSGDFGPMLELFTDDALSRVDALLFEFPSAFAGERPEVIPEEADALSGMFDARFLPRDMQPQVLV